MSHLFHCWIGTSNCLLRINYYRVNDWLIKVQKSFIEYCFGSSKIWLRCISKSWRSIHCLDFHYLHVLSFVKLIRTKCNVIIETLVQPPWIFVCFSIKKLELIQRWSNILLLHGKGVVLVTQLYCSLRHGNHNESATLNQSFLQLIVPAFEIS